MAATLTLESVVERDPNCVFCRIVAAEIPAAVVSESESTLAFLDVAPLAEGHLLLIPRRHYVHLTDAPPALCSELAVTLPRLARALLDVTGAEGFNLLLNSGEVAGQVVPHVHFHLIPRRAGDALGYRWNAGRYSEGRDAELAAAYQAALARHQG